MPPRVRAIALQVSLARFVPLSRMFSYQRGQRDEWHVTAARREVWRRVREEIRVNGAPPSYPLMGRWFGRHHSTILIGVRLSTGPTDSVEIGRGQLLRLEALS